MVMKGGGIQRGSSVYFVIFIILTTPADSGLITEQSVTECECPENRCPHRPEEGVCGYVVPGDTASRMILTLSKKDLDHSRLSTVCVEKCCNGFEQISAQPLTCIVKAGPEVAKHRRYSSCNSNEGRIQCASCNHGMCINDVCVCQERWSGQCCDKGPPSRPHGVVIAAVRAYSVTVMWEAPANGGSVAVTSYSITVTTRNGNSNVFIVKGATVANITELNPDTEYRLRINARNSFGISPFSDPVKFRTGGNYPSRPQNLAVTNKTSRSLTVEWSPPLTPNGVILNYQVSYVGLESVNPVPDSFETVETLNLSGTTYTVDVAGLSPHSLYNISVKAFTSIGGGEESTVTIRTEEDTPSAPFNLTVTEVTISSMTVEWSQPVFPNGIVDFYVVSFCNGSIPIETKGTNDHSYTLQGLLPAWQYAVTVKAHTNSYGNISKLTAVTLGVPPVIRPMRGSSEQLVHVGDPIILRFIISEAVPLVPVNNITWYFTSISGQQTTLSCPGHSPKYRFSAHCLTLTIGDASISDGGLYEVFVFTRAGENSSRIAVIITGDFPSMPLNVRIVEVTSHSVGVVWEAPTNEGDAPVSVYNITVDSVLSGGVFVMRTTRVANITGLNPDTKYSLRISAKNFFGMGPFSGPVSFRTEEINPSRPQNLTVTNKTSRSLTVEWSPPLTPNGVILNYQVSYVGLESVNPVPDSFETVKTLNLSGTTYTADVAGLSPHSLYNISVKAFTSVGGGEESTVTIWTEEDAPSAPSNLTLTRVTTNSITVEWSQPVYPNGIVESFVIVLTEDVSHAEVDRVTTAGNASNHLVTFSGLLSVWPYTIHVAAFTNSLGSSSTITTTTYGVSPVTEPVNGTTEQLVKNGHSVILKFVIVEADPPVPVDNITWYFTSISGRTFLPCTNHSTKYNFSSNCLTLTIGNVNASDGGLYEVFVSTRAGEDSSSIAVTIREVPPQFLSLLENKTVQVSTNHMFVCAASGDPRLVFTWRFNEEKIDNTGPKYSIASNTTVSILVISDVTGLDEGVYKCSVSNRFGQEATSAYLTVQVPPVITVGPSSTRDVVAGEVLSVTCAAVGEPAPRIRWYHRGSILNTNMSDSAVLITSEITSKTTISSLKIQNVSNEDDGPYSCVAVNFLGNDSRDLAVTLVVRPVIAGITVQLNSSNISNLTHGGVLTMEEFTPVDLTCSASGLPAPVIVWLKGGAVLTNSSSRVIENTIGNTSQRVDGTFKSTTTLRFNSLQLADSSTYTCRAVSGNVSPIPGVTSWTFEINVTARNECMVLPPPCLNDGVCIDGVGQPVCRCAIEEVGAFYGKHCQRVSDKAVPPYITEEPKDNYVNVGNRVTLQCKAGGIPDPVVTWFKDGEALGGPQAVGENYTIMEMTPEQRGVYHCQAENDRGTVNSDIAKVLILGLAQVRVGLGEDGQKRNKRQSVSNAEVIEWLELLAVNKVLRTESGMELTIYSIKHAADNPEEMIVTLLADNSTASGTDIANAALGPLRMLFGEYSDVFPTISFEIRGSERFDGCPTLEDQTCSNVASVTWPQTEIGEIATVKCPCGVEDELINRLQATRVCGGTYTSGAEWKDPICEECKFSETRRKLCSLGLIENPVHLARALDDAAKNASEFLKEDVSLSATLLGRVVADRKALRKPAVQLDVLSVVSSVNSITPNVLKASQSITGSSSKVLNVIDDVAENTDTSDGIYLYSSWQFGLLVAPAEAVGNTSYPLNITLLLNLVANKTSSANVSTSDSVQIPGFLLKRNSRVSSTIFTNHALFQSRDQYISETGEQFTQVGSSVLSISVLGETVSGLNDDERVQFVFSKTQKAHNGTRCQFWNVSLDESFGSWDDSGCELVNETDTTVVCKCNHLTHFALLMDVSPDSSIHPPTVNDVILTWVSYIGAGICIVCLGVTIIANLAMKSLRNALYTKLLIHLCTALIGLYIAFIVGTFAMPVPVLCGIISALMHYFFLATFLWMASLAIFIFRSIIQPFELPFRNHYEISGAICWVVPVFIVAFSLAPRHQNYYHKEFCRVQGYSFWIGVLVPFGVIYVFNWIVFIIITISLVRRPNMKKESGKKDNQWKENLAVSAILSVLFGLGWASGFLASTDVEVDFIRVPFEWVFTVLNCSQGVLIFYVYCLRPPEVRKKLKHMISLCNHGERANSINGHCTSTRSKFFDPAPKQANGSEINVPTMPREQFSFPQNDNSYAVKTKPGNPGELLNDVKNCTLSDTQVQIRSSACEVASPVHLNDLNNGSNNALGIVEQANGNKHAEISSVM